MEAVGDSGAGAAAGAARIEKDSLHWTSSPKATLQRMPVPDVVFAFEVAEKDFFTPGGNRREVDEALSGVLDLDSGIIDFFKQRQDIQVLSGKKVTAITVLCEVEVVLTDLDRTAAKHLKAPLFQRPQAGHESAHTFPDPGEHLPGFLQREMAGEVEHWKQWYHPDHLRNAGVLGDAFPKRRPHGQTAPVRITLSTRGCLSPVRPVTEAIRSTTG